MSICVIRGQTFLPKVSRHEMVFWKDTGFAKAMSMVLVWYLDSMTGPGIVLFPMYDEMIRLGQMQELE